MVVFIIYDLLVAGSENSEYTRTYLNIIDIDSV